MRREREREREEREEREERDLIISLFVFSRCFLCYISFSFSTIA
jgi:hypothetical protein